MQHRKLRIWGRDDEATASDFPVAAAKCTQVLEEITRRRLYQNVTFLGGISLCSEEAMR